MTTKMTIAKRATIASCTMPLIFLAACGGGGTGPGKVIKKFPVDSATEVIARENVSTDSGISVDGNGSLKINVSGKQTLPLYKLEDIDIEKAVLTYQAALRTDSLDGSACLEMICFFNGKGEFFSRNYDSALSGTNAWTIMSTPFRFRKGENPDIIELNIYVTGMGTVWIDDIKLLKLSLK